MAWDFLRLGMDGLFNPVALLLLIWAVAATVAVGCIGLRSQRARVKQSHLQALLDSIPDLTWIKDKDGRFLLVNRQYSRTFGCSVSFVIGKTDFDLTTREQALSYLAGDQTVIRENRTLKIEERITGTDGREFWAETIKVPVLSETGEVIGTAGMARDITERKHSESRIRFLAHHDYLTGLNNRLSLEQRCEAFLSGVPDDARCALIFIDLDNFKIINDSLGHRVGDAVLKALAGRISKLVSANEWVARFGGDEFVIFVSQAGDDKALARLVDTVLTNIRQPVESDKMRFDLTASMGVSRYPQDARSFEEMLRCADLAMYQAKHQGPNKACFYEANLGGQSL
ncbi:MAG: GGDEF domain-containing protein, partial [Natronospirillum sp.]